MINNQRVNTKSIQDAQAYVGSCNEMCPQRERMLRLSSPVPIFERNIETNEPDEYAMVKEYRRAGADQEEPSPSDLRTKEALQLTIDYLVSNIMDDPRSKQPDLALEWYDYLWDRLRAIRKDITQQNFCDQQSAILVERCTRFHIHACYSMNHIKEFDVDMNRRNLNDCLQMLRQIYADIRTNTAIDLPGELDFIKYDILLHLDEDHLSTNVLLKTCKHRSSKEIKFTTSLFQAYTNNDYYTFFKLMKQADYMTSCILSLYVNRVRLIGLRIMIASCPAKQMISYPAELMIETLAFDGLEDLRTFLEPFGIELFFKDSKPFVKLYKDLINFIRNIGAVTTMKSKVLVENKTMGLTVGQLVYGPGDFHTVRVQAKPVEKLSVFLGKDIAPEREEMSADCEQAQELDEQEDDAIVVASSFSFNTSANDSTMSVQLLGSTSSATATATAIGAPTATSTATTIEIATPTATSTWSSADSSHKHLSGSDKLVEQTRPRRTSLGSSADERQQIGAPVRHVAEEARKSSGRVEREPPHILTTPPKKRPRSLAELADMMPVGRFSAKTSSFLFRKSTPPAAKPVAAISRSMPQKNSVMSVQLNELTNSLTDEKEANRNLYKLIKLLI